MKLSMLKIYNSGNYILETENSSFKLLKKFYEYICGVTIARSSINRIKPSFISSLDGDILEIGGFDNFFKDLYKNRKILNLDIQNGPCIDLVEDAENMVSVQDSSFSAVICISVLEHTVHPLNVIDEIHRILKPGGYALISVPWMFESHMEPQDYFRFSPHFICLLEENFTIDSVELTNGYFGLLAHFCQHNLLLRFTIGIVFLMVDFLIKPNSRWSTQVSFVLQKKP
jgi:SAM-dependent methyltransferase